MQNRQHLIVSQKDMLRVRADLRREGKKVVRSAPVSLGSDEKLYQLTVERRATVTR